MDEYPHRMYHPTLAPPHNECDAHTEGQERVYAEAGWLPVPDAPEAKPGYAPEPLRYVQGDDGNWAPEEATEPEPEPETDKPAAKPARTRKAVKATDEQNTEGVTQDG